MGQDHRAWEREGLARTEKAFAEAPESVDLDRAHREGELLTMEGAVALARRLLAVTPASNGRRSSDNGAAGGLSQREADVLALLAEGCSNQAIGERLFVSAKTVERHLSNLYRKLDVSNRTQAAAYAIRHSQDT